MYKRVVLIASFFVLALSLVACGSSPAASKNAGNQVKGNTDPSSQAQQPVTVQVEAGDFYIKPSQTTFKVGVPYHFVFQNTGKVPHEVMLMPVVEPSSGMTMEDMDKMAMGMVEEEDFPAGATGSFDVTFEKPYGPNEIELACHITGHYEAGMHAPITVVASQ